MTTQTQIKTDEDELAEAEAEHKAQQNNKYRRPVQTPEHAYARIIDIDDNPEDYIDFEVVLDTGAYQTLRVTDLDRFKSFLGIQSLAAAEGMDIPVEYEMGPYIENGPYYTAYDKSDKIYKLPTTTGNIIGISSGILTCLFLLLSIHLLSILVLDLGFIFFICFIWFMMNTFRIYDKHYEDNINRWTDIGF